MRAGEHVADEALVSGYVDDAEALPADLVVRKASSIEMPRSFSACRRSVSWSAPAPAPSAVIDVRRCR
jgi:hypothetical protein